MPQNFLLSPPLFSSKPHLWLGGPAGLKVGPVTSQDAPELSLDERYLRYGSLLQGCALLIEIDL